jgi:exopolyphosphatase/pppGpp-phosphohydrolase
MKTMKQAEIRKNGYQALINSLGVVGTLRFLQQLDIGSGDYTLERHQVSELTLKEFQEFTSTRSGTL